MTWHLTADPARFDAAAGGFLRGDPVSHTGLLTVLDALGARGLGVFGDPPLFGWWSDEQGLTAGAFVHTPPYPLLAARLPGTAVSALPEALVTAGHRVLAVNAAGPTAEAFAAAWMPHTGTARRVVERQRLYRLDVLTPPDPAPSGVPRIAGAADRNTLIAYVTAFGAETRQTGADIAATVDHKLARREYTVWDDGGTPVAYAAVTPTVAGVARVGQVYTVPEFRGRGYGAAVTSARTAVALADGAAEVVLFTDLANPTSNAVYQRIGYRAVEDRVILGFPATDDEETPA